MHFLCPKSWQFAKHTKVVNFIKAYAMYRKTERFLIGLLTVVVRLLSFLTLLFMQMQSLTIIKLNPNRKVFPILFLWYTHKKKMGQSKTNKKKQKIIKITHKNTLKIRKKTDQKKTCKKQK